MAHLMRTAVVVVLLAALAGCGQTVAPTTSSAPAELQPSEASEQRRLPEKKVAAQPRQERKGADKAKGPVAVEAEPAPVPAPSAQPVAPVEPVEEPAAEQPPAQDPPAAEDPPAKQRKQPEPPRERHSRDDEAEDDPEDEPEADPSSLDNTGWRSVRVTQDGEPRALIDGTRVRLAFEQRSSSDVIRWRSGCNSVGAELTITSTRLKLEPAAGTDMYCSEEHSEQDGWVSEFFSRDPAWNLDGDRLRLRAGDIVMVFQRATYW